MTEKEKQAKFEEELKKNKSALRKAGRCLYNLSIIVAILSVWAFSIAWGKHNMNACDFFLKSFLISIIIPCLKFGSGLGKGARW